MIVEIRRWYSGRSAREQRLLLIMGLVAVPVLIWLLLVMPLGSAYRGALDRHLEAVDRRGRVAALAELGKAQVQPVPAAGGDIVMILSDRGRQASLDVTVQPGGSSGSARVAMASAPASAATSWLTQLEAAGYSLDQVRITPKGDGTVSVEATVRSGRQ